MREDGAPAIAKIRGTVSNMRSGRCKNESYFKKFSVNYSDSYRDNDGNLIHVNMRQYVVGFNEVARKIRSEIEDGDVVYVVGRLKSRYIENYEEEVFIEIEEPEDIVKLPSEGEI